MIDTIQIKAIFLLLFCGTVCFALCLLSIFAVHSVLLLIHFRTICTLPPLMLMLFYIFMLFRDYRNFMETAFFQILSVSNRIHFSGSTVTLLTSSFSHMSVLHLGLNMMVLWSLAPLAQGMLSISDIVMQLE